MAGVARKTTYVVNSRRRDDETKTWFPVEVFDLFTAARYYVEKLPTAHLLEYEYAIDKHETTTKVSRMWTERG